MTAHASGSCASTRGSTSAPPSSSPTTCSRSSHSRSSRSRPTTDPSSGTSFHYHPLDKGVGHRYIKPRTPRLNGKVERSHRIDAEEFYRLLEGAVIDDARVFNDKL